MRSLSSIAPIILAAGDSSRMGFPKALLPLGRDTFLTRILNLVVKVGLPEPTVILGRAAPIIQEGIRGWSAHIWVNPNPERGQLSSIQMALSHLAMEAEACLIWPVDHPAVSEGLVRDLTHIYISSDSLIACPVHEGKRGHPAIFHRALFKEFMSTPPAEGPKGILLRHERAMILLPTSDAGVILDIDTPSDYQALTGESLSAALATRNIPAVFQS